MIRICSLLLTCWLAVTTNTHGQVLIDQIQTNFPAIKQLTVRGAFCMIDVQRGRTNDVWINGEIRSTRYFEGIRIEYAQKDSMLEVWIDLPQKETGLLKGFLLFDVPQNLELKIETLSGNIMIDRCGIRNTELASVNGSIEAFKIEGDLNAKTISGTIDVSEVSGHAELSSVTGNIKLTNVKKGATVSNASGTVVFSDISGEVVVKTISGPILANATHGQVYLSTSIGNIEMYGLTGVISANSASGSVRGRDLNLTGDSLFKTISGDIDILLTNNHEELTFDLQSTKGKLTLNDNTQINHLKSGNGPVMVTGISLQGNQVYH